MLFNLLLFHSLLHYNSTDFLTSVEGVRGGSQVFTQLHISMSFMNSYASTPIYDHSFSIPASGGFPQIWMEPPHCRNVGHHKLGPQRYISMLDTMVYHSKASICIDANQPSHWTLLSIRVEYPETESHSYPCHLTFTLTRSRTRIQYSELCLLNVTKPAIDYLWFHRSFQIRWLTLD